MINIPKPKSNGCKKAFLLEQIYNTVNAPEFATRAEMERFAIYCEANEKWQSCGCSNCWMNIISIIAIGAQIGDEVEDFIKPLARQEPCTYKQDEFHPSDEHCNKGGMGELFDHWIDQINDACNEYEDMPDPKATEFALFAMTFRAYKELLEDCGCCACFHNASIIGRNAQKLGVNMELIMNELKH